MTDSLDRIDELLLSEATCGLSDAEQAELQALLDRHEDVDRYVFVRAASTFFLAVCADPSERMPATLSARLRRDADTIMSSDSE